MEPSSHNPSEEEASFLMSSKYFETSTTTYAHPMAARLQLGSARLEAPVLAVCFLLAGLRSADTAQSAVGQSTVPMNMSGPTCQAVEAYGIPRSLIDAFLGTLSPPPASQLCSWLQPKGFCTCAAAVEWGLGQTTDLTMQCNAGWQVAPLGSPIPFADLRPLPPDLSNSSMLAAEGPTYYWLYRNLCNLEQYTPCAPSGQGELLLPEGWQLHAMLNLSQGSDSESTPPLPFVALLVQPQEQALAILARGALTAHEWGLDFSWNQTEEHSGTFGAPVHWGFGWVFGEVWPGVQGALQALAVDSKEVKQVFVAGHSLGAAVGSLLAFAAQAYLNEQLGAEEAPVVSAALFAPPNVGPAAFVSNFNDLVNARRIAYEDDIVAQSPCVPDFPSCSSDSIDPLYRPLLSGHLIPTNQPGDVGEWPYEQIGGIAFTAQQMPQDAASWDALNYIQLCWSAQYLFASHVCSYSCWTLQWVAGAADVSNCWLSSMPEGASGSYCFLWPSDYPGMQAGELPPPPLPDPAVSPSPSAGNGTSAGVKRDPAPPLLLLALLVLAATSWLV